MTRRSDSLSIAVMVILMFSVWEGCGRDKIPVQAPPPPPPELVAPPNLIQVVGKAQFGSQCALGFFAPPSQVPLELWTCPIGLDPVELVEPLSPLVLQVDCKKKIMDLRGVDRSSVATTWEMMPDGSFYFKVDGGVAKLKDDGAGHKNCSIPLHANLWGKVDCKVRDQAVIQLEAVWWLGAQPEEPSPQVSPSPIVSSLPGSSPSSIPLPSVSPSPSLAFYIIPGLPNAPGEPNVEPSVDSTVASRGDAASGPVCKVPVGCFFHSATQINPCL